MKKIVAIVAVILVLLVALVYMTLVGLRAEKPGAETGTPALNTATLQYRSSPGFELLRSSLSLSAGATLDVMFYFDNDDCSGGALFGRDDRPGYIFPVGHKSWEELAALKPRTEKSHSVPGITPIGKDKEGLAFWVKTKTNDYTMVRIKEVQPASYAEILAWEKTASITLEWLRE